MKLYILEQWTHDFGDSYSDILGVYSSLDKARDYIDWAGYRYEDGFFQEYSEYLETHSKEEDNGVHKTISILERELNKDLGELVFEAVGTMKLYILEQWTHDFGDSYSDILGVYSSLDKARDYIDWAGYRYEDGFFQEYSEYLETHSKEEDNGVHKTISILERELNKDLGELVFEAVGTE